MVKQYPASSIKGLCIAVRDVLWIPGSIPPDGDVPFPYATLILTSKEEPATKVYSVKSGKVSKEPILEAAHAPTFIVFDDGRVSVHRNECRTLADAQRAVESEVGAKASATVVSIDKDGNDHIAFRVTPEPSLASRIEIREWPDNR
jgi:hypothetical protein